MEPFQALFRAAVTLGLALCLASLAQVTVNTARYMKNCHGLSPVAVSLCRLLPGTVPVDIADVGAAVPNPEASDNSHKYLDRLREFLRAYLYSE